MQSPQAPGQDQAKRAVEKSELEAKKPEATVVEADVPVSQPKKKTPSAAAAKGGGGGKAQNMGLSLHPADLERIYLVESALRKAGIKGRSSTSLLIKLALATFDASKVENLVEIYEQLEAQDGRRRKS